MHLIIIVIIYNYFRFLLLHLVQSLLYLQHILIYPNLFLYYKIPLLYHTNLCYMYCFLQILYNQQSTNTVCQQVEHFWVFVLLLLHTQFFRSPGVSSVTILSESPILLSSKTIPLVFIIPIYFPCFVSISFIFLYSKKIFISPVFLKVFHAISFSIKSLSFKNSFCFFIIFYTSKITISFCFKLSCTSIIL